MESVKCHELRDHGATLLWLSKIMRAAWIKRPKCRNKKAGGRRMLIFWICSRPDRIRDSCHPTESLQPYHELLVSLF